jgi:hypothetical protein
MAQVVESLTGKCEALSSTYTTTTTTTTKKKKPSFKVLEGRV